MKRWEYAIIYLEYCNHLATLKEYGLRGWELVSVTTDSHNNPTAYLKREIT